MKKNIFLSVLLLSVIYMSCDKEDGLTPSNLGKDWFVIEDSNDPVDHAVYQFYMETGIPVFYNDTIGKEERVDQWGNAYIHYEMLHFGASSLGGTEVVNPFMNYELCSKESVLDGIEFLREEIVPILPKSIKVRSFLLLNSMTPYNATMTSNEAFKGLNTVLVARISALKNMSEADRKNLKGAVLNAVLATPISAYADELAAFYQVTRSCYTENLYGCAGWYFYNRYGFSDPRAVGFLKDPNSYDYSNMPTEMGDVGMYIKAIFTYSADEFKAKYGAFDAVMKKYEILTSVLKKIGVTI